MTNSMPELFAEVERLKAELERLNERFDRYVESYQELAAERDTWESEYERVRDTKLAQHQDDGLGYCTGCSGDRPVPWLCDTARALQGVQPGDDTEDHSGH